MFLTIWFPAFAGMTMPVHAQNLSGLRHDLDSLFSDTAFSNATFGVAIKSLTTGEYLYRLNDTKSLMPASNMKLFTTAEALAFLGPEFRFVTTVQLERDGHVTIMGSGDPSFCSATQYGDSGRFDSLRSIASALREMKVDTVKMLSVQGASEDSNITLSYPEGWEIEDIWQDYAPEIRWLNFDENQIAFSVSPSDTVGAHARITFDSTNFGFFKVNSFGTTTTAADSEPPLTFVPNFLHNSVNVFGFIGNRSKPVIEHVAVHNAGLFAANAIRGIFEQCGIHVSHIDDRAIKDQTDVDPPDRILTYSPPLSQLVRTMNKESDNLYAECLLNTVDLDDGVLSIRKYLDSLGIDTSRIQFTDGSGLSRMDLVTADDIVTLLRAMASNPKLDSVFYNSLPIMGVDGTLKNRLKGTPAQGNIHAKTGSMTGVRSISGYLTTRDGEPIAFSILANNYTVPGGEIGKLEDAVLLRLVNFSRK